MRTMRRRLIIALVFLGMAIIFATGYRVGYKTSLNQLVRQGETGLTLVTERLMLQLDKFRFLPSVLGNEPAIQAILENVAAIERGNRLLQRIADTSGASDIFVLATDGSAVASSNWNLERSFVGENFAWQPYFKRAIRGGLGFYNAVGTKSNTRGYYFSHPIQNSQGRIVGVIVVKVDLDRIESQWRADPQVLFFSNDDGVIFLSNRRDLVFGALHDGRSIDPQRYANVTISILTDIAERTHLGYEFWETRGYDLPENGVFLSEYSPRIAMTAHTLIDTAPARTQGLLWGSLVAISAGLLSVLAAFVLQRRASIAAQLAIRSQAQLELEAKVVERTSALKKAQNELVQAGKLSALGQMSAGISHELNQPLAAIQSLADNSEILMEREKFGDVATNLTKMSQVAQRMGRIIRNFRAFARKEGEALSNVDAVSVVSDALSIVRHRASSAGVDLNWDAPRKPLIVRGGRVRLQQVIVNLVGNGIDALEHTLEKRIGVEIREDANTVTISVRDNGPGLESPEQVFDPFYTTKEVGEGLGLGLSISYGIVQSFDGKIVGYNHAKGGAVFTITLPKPSAKEAAA